MRVNSSIAFRFFHFLVKIKSGPKKKLACNGSLAQSHAAFFVMERFLSNVPLQSWLLLIAADW